MEQTKIVSRDSEIMSGELVFAGTHVEVKTLIDYLKADHSVDDFGGHYAAGKEHRVRRSRAIGG
jgi:uncharacterized protein (DUF433 family)